MKFKVHKDELVDAVTWTAHSIPKRPPLPVLAGVLLEVDDERLTVSGFDYEVSTQATVDADVITAGRVLVSGHLLADIVRSLPASPVEFTVDGPRLTITSGRSRFTLPTMPVEDYPALPVMPETVGTIPGPVFATAVAQVAVASGRDDTIPMLTGVHLSINGSSLTLAATDRYRLAERTFDWTPQDAGGTAKALIPARTLLDAAKALADAAEVTVALASSDGAGSGMIGFSSGDRRLTTRLLDAEFLKYDSLWPTTVTGTADLQSSQFAEVAKRVSLVASRGTPVRLAFTADAVAFTAGGEDDGQAEESLSITYDGEPFTIGFNLAFLLDGITATGSDTVQLAFNGGTKPAVLSAAPTDRDAGPADYRYLAMPMRLNADGSSA